MAVELVFRQRDGDDEYRYWVVVRGDGEPVDTSPCSLDADHRAFDERCRERGWQIATPEIMLMPATVREHVVDWCLLPQAPDDGRT